MKTILKSKIFISFFIVITLASFIFFLNSMGTYQSETDILLIPRNFATAQNISKITYNTKEIITSLDFYDALNSELILDKSDIQRKNDWQNMVKVKIVKRGSILKIFTFGANQPESETLSRQVARLISDKMSQYYNIKSELEIRIIEGPITKKNLNFFRLSSWLLSLLFGIAGGLLAYLFFNSVKIIEKPIKFTFKKNEVERKTVFPEEKPYVFKNKEHPIREDHFQPTQNISSLVPAASSKKSAAPENLPISDSVDFSFEKKEEEDSKEEIKEILEKAHDQEKVGGVREATPEEVKARLNLLLKGKL